jgi:nucleotide-binding universal stress UspA family protein
LRYSGQALSKYKDVIMKTIILGIDFQGNTLEFCEQAVLHAKKLNCSITMVHVVEFTPYYPYFPYDQEKVNDFHSRIMRNEIKELESYIKLHGLKVEKTVIKHGITHEVLCDVANSCNASAILIGVGDHFMLDRLIGSTTEKISKQASQKVIILNHVKKGEVEKVMCAFDFSENSMRALESAIQFSHFFNSELIVTHISNHEFEEDLLKQETEVQLMGMVKLQEGIYNEKFDFEYKIRVFTGEPVTIISEMVESANIDVLFIGARGKNPFRHLLMGSTVSKIIRKSPCSIVVAPKVTMSESQQKSSA